MSVTHIANAKGIMMPDLESTEETQSSDQGSGFVKDFSIPDEGGVDNDMPTHSYGPASTTEDEVEDEDTSNTNEDEPDSLEGEQEDVVDDDSGDENEGDEQSQDPISTDLLLRAGALGVPVDQVKFYGEQGEEIFKQHLDMFESNNAKGKDGDVKPASGEFKDPEDFTFEFKEDEGDEIDPEILTALKGLNGHITNGMKEARKTVEMVGNAVATYRDNQIFAEVNESIDELSSEFESILGAGKDGLLDAGSVAYKNRDAVMNEIYAIQDARNKSGHPPMTIKRAFAQAVKEVTGKSIDKKTQTTQKKLTRRRGSATPKSGRKMSGVGAGALNGEARAAKGWDDAIRG